MKKILTGLLAALFVLTALPMSILAAQPLSVTPAVTDGKAAVNGDVLTLVKGQAATIAFTPNQNLDIIAYQYGTAGVTALTDAMEDVTSLESDNLVPAFTFKSTLAAGEYELTLTLTENEEYATVFEKTYTVNVIELASFTVAPSVKAGKALVDGDVITLTRGNTATVAFTPSVNVDSIAYQYGTTAPEALGAAMQDDTPLEDNLVPTFTFKDTLAAGEYKLTLTVTENDSLLTAFEKVYTVKVVEPGVEIVPDKDAPALSLGTSSDDLRDMALTKEEADAGYSVVVTVKTAEPTAAQKEQLAGAMNGFQEGLFLDISLFKSKDGADTAITTLNGKLRMTVAIPEELQKTGRRFVMLRHHEGQVETLPDLDSDPAAYTFETDAFSLYALAYSDETVTTGPAPTTPPTEVPNVPTGHGAPFWALGLAVAALGAFAAAGILGRARKAR